MAYSKQAWRDYDDTKTENQNRDRGAVVTPERLNHMETGIANSAERAELEQTKQDITAQLAHKADKTDKINANQLATDLDENKIKLSNLSQEVIQSIKGQFATELYSKSSNTLISGYDFGTLTIDSSYHALTHEDLITVTDDLSLTITNNYNLNMLVSIAGYDENSNYLSHEFRQSYKVGHYIEIPTEYKKIRITVEKIELAGATFSDSDEVQIGKGVLFINTEIKDNSIGTEKYADNSITLDKLDNYISDFIKDNNVNIASYPSDFFIDGYDVDGRIQNNTENNINICNKELISVFELGTNALTIEGDVEGLHYIIAYYDNNKNFVEMSSWSTDFSLITIPEDVYYFRITISHTDPSISFESTSFKLLKAKQNEGNENIGKTHIVAKSGGEFTTINSAVTASSDGDTIIVYPGIYDETVRAWNKEVSIVGVSKKHCILKRGTGEYLNPPLEIGAGLVQNMTILADSSNPAVSPEDTTSKAYGVHVETDFSTGKTLEFRDCYLSSDWNAALGVGLRPNFTLKLVNCELEGNYLQATIDGGSSFAHLGALFFHDSASDLGDNQRIIVDNCRLHSIGEYAIVPYCLNYSENTSYVTFYNTIAWSDINKKDAAAIWFRNAPNGAWAGQNMHLTEDSFGNNITVLNS